MFKKSADEIGIGSVFNKLTNQLGDPVEFELPNWLNKCHSDSYVFIKRSILSKIDSFVKVKEPNFTFIVYSFVFTFTNVFGYPNIFLLVFCLYILTNLDIYVTKKPKRRHDDDGIFCSCVQSPGSNACCGRDCHCGMLLSTCSSNCKCGSDCVNKPFQQRPVKKMKLVQTEKCGSGIVADEDIKQGEFVIEYVGEVIDDKTCEERLWIMKHRGVTNFYLCEINRDMVIDATFKGNKSRYINHSCCPNTEMQKWSVDGETRIGIFATCDIKKGEHLTYDYQFVQFGADQDCHCGAPSCRRKLGVKPNKRMPSSDAALKLVARQVAASSPKVKAILLGKNVYQNGGFYEGLATNQRRNFTNCIGEVVKIRHPNYRRSFGIIKRFDTITKKHLIMFEDGSRKCIDLSKEDWDFCNFLL